MNFGNVQVNSPAHSVNGAEGTLPGQTPYLLAKAADKADLIAWRRVPRLVPDISCANLVKGSCFPAKVETDIYFYNSRTANTVVVLF